MSISNQKDEDEQAFHTQTTYTHNQEQNDTVEQSLEKLRDTYMNYKDMYHRCLVDIKQIEKGDNRIFYFKPETFLLEEPEKQKVYRDKLLKKIQTPPAQEPIIYMGDELHRSLIESITDKSKPSQARKMLAQYYKRRHYNLQHKKYKVLIRWAHHAMTTEYMERIGHEATFKYGKIEYEMENSMNRYDRLEGDDGFDDAPVWSRPRTKAKEGGSLYVENIEIEPTSSIRMDDIDVYLRQITYFQKINMLMSKYLVRLKWLPVQKRFQIFQESVESYNKLKENNINRQQQDNISINNMNIYRQMIQRIQDRAKQVYGESQDVLEEVLLISESYHYSKYKQKIQNKSDQILQSQLCEHDTAPFMIDNSIELKLIILDKALLYGIYGDIELDQGYSFSYQVTIFFPTYFQRQIIKSQFSIYDAFASDSLDQNIVQKRNLSMMSKIDTNIFRDISTSSKNIPTQESLNLDFGSKIKVIRLKSCLSWIDYVIMQPQINPCLQKQTAILSVNNPIDSLLRSAINFLDVNDLATTNRILEETSRLHQQQQKLRLVIDTNNKNSMSNENRNIKDHFTNALKGDISQQQKDPIKNIPLIEKHSIRYLHQHLIHAYYILRHLKSRDYKTQILYSLNYFRTIQKRLMLDLREFGTRERIMGDQTQPIIPSDESSKVAQQNANSTYFKKFGDLRNVVQQMNQDTKQGSDIQPNQVEPQQFSSIFEDGYLKLESGLVDLKKFKFKGKFNNKCYSTCPSLPRYHSTFGEPIEYQPLNVEMERVGAIKHSSVESVKLMGRVDHIEIDEENREVYIKDDFGIYILYDCTLQDIKDLEEELLKIGSYYISKHEALINTETDKPYPLVDRITLIEDLLMQESKFQYEKVNLIQCYMECYEHINDSLEQQRLMQIIIDIMGQRPRLNLQASYFMDSYDIEIQCLNKHRELVRQLIQTQMLIEKEENKRIQAYIDLSYRITTDQQKGKWSYHDAEDFFKELQKRKAIINQLHGKFEPQKDDEIKLIINNNIGVSVSNVTIQKQDNIVEDNSPTKRFLNRINKVSYNNDQVLQNDTKKQSNKVSDDTQKDINFLKIDDGLKYLQENTFATVLGLPPITVESLYTQYKEKDEAILEIMNEHSNYIKVYEGYPDFIIDFQGGISSKLSNIKITNESLPINILDFYESLQFITKFYSTIQCIQNELIESLKPHDNNLFTLIELKIFEYAQIEFQKTQAFLNGSLIEFEGQEYIQDQSILGNSDKISFYIKDFVSNLQKSLKININPFYIGKLDIDTIQNFDFPQVFVNEHPFKNQKSPIKEQLDSIIQVAQTNNKYKAQAIERFIPTFKDYNRQISYPSLLILYCNAMEVIRLRQELVYSISECVLLTEVYEQQCKFVNKTNYQSQFSDKINFEKYLIDTNLVNYIDDGAASFINIDLAINEFDPLLKANLNFRNPDSFKVLCCPSGLEELRAVLHYQIMQKQLLIIGVRTNQLLINTHLRALTELELIKKGYSLPNMIVKVQSILSKSGDGFNTDGFNKEKNKYINNMNNEAAQVFYQVTNRKSKLRTTMSKKFAVFLNQANQTYGKVECSLRVLRTYKIKLLHCYCKDVMKEAYHDTLRLQTISQCQKLRVLTQLFSFEEPAISKTTNQSKNAIERPQIFKYESNEYIENFFSSYNPFYKNDKFANHNSLRDQYFSQNAVINNDKAEILDYLTIPSTISIAKCETITFEEMRILNEKHPSFEFKLNITDNDPEISIKQLLPVLHEINQELLKDDNDKQERISVRIVDFEESYDYSKSQFGQLFTYYALVERIFRVEYFLSRISANVLDVLQMEHCIFNGLPFWELDISEEINKSIDKDSLEGDDKLSQKILNKIVAEKRARINLADDMQLMAQTLSQVFSRIQIYIKPSNTETVTVQLTQMNKTKCLEYLITYSEYRYYFLIYALEKIIDSYYIKGCAKEVKYITDQYLILTKKDHVKIIYNHNAFHVNLAIIKPQLLSLESSNINFYHCNNEEQQNFQMCIQPIINEQALNPPQLSIFQTMFVTPRQKVTQHSGQIPQYQQYYPSLINLNELERQYTNSNILNIKDFLKDYLDDTMTFEQIKIFKKVLCDLILSRQLKHAMMIWISGTTLPLDPIIYNQQMTRYKNEYFWKILNYKQNIPSPLSQQVMQSSRDVFKISSPYKHQSKNFLLQIDLDQKAKNNEQIKNAEKSMIMSQNYRSLQTQSMIDQVQTSKAEISIITKELDRQLIIASIQVINDEQSALSNCFLMTSKSIDAYVHPFQQFASTCYSNIDRSSHLDMVTKVTEVQKFITKLKNRGTEVETLTSGPGIVFTVKDFNECLQGLCRGLIKYGEKEMRARSEDMFKKESHFMNLLYIKDQSINNLQKRIENTRDNLDKLINCKMYEKGNQLIYELDCVNRQLRLFKDNVFEMESKLVARIKGDMSDNLRKNAQDVERNKNKFKDYKEQVTTKIKADLASEQSRIDKALKKKAEEYKNLNSNSTNKPHIRAMYAQMELNANLQKLNINNPIAFINIQSPELIQQNQISEEEARQELYAIWEVLRKQRIFWRMRNVVTVEKYEREIFTLKKGMTSNACLWEQLAEAEKREKVLKQELVFTQQSLAASEKVIEKLKDDLKKSESDRIRLNQYKTNKARRLDELEGKVRKFEILENIDLEKLIGTLESKEKELVSLKDIKEHFNQRIEAVELRKDQDIKAVKQQLCSEQNLKQDVLQRLENLRLELSLLEKNEGSMAGIWKVKCKELVDISSNLKNENEILKQRLLFLISNFSVQQSNQANEIIKSNEETQNQSWLQQYYKQQNQLKQKLQLSNIENPNNSFSLPKLIINSSNAQQINSKNGSIGSSMSQSRHSSLSKNINAYNKNQNNKQGIKEEDLSTSRDQPLIGISEVQNSHEISTSQNTVSKQQHSKTHNRGKSLFDVSQSQQQESKQITDRSFQQSHQIIKGSQNIQQYPLNKTQNQFAVFGQKAQNQNILKGYQSVRTSQVVAQGIQNIKLNDDLQQYISQGVDTSESKQVKSSLQSKQRESNKESKSVNRNTPGQARKQQYEKASQQQAIEEQTQQLKRIISQNNKDLIYNNDEIHSGKVSFTHDNTPRTAQYGELYNQIAVIENNQTFVGKEYTGDKDSIGNVSAFKGSIQSQERNNIQQI